jgi:photosystem II stability/assembly factor-like uncharacterized protein
VSLVAGAHRAQAGSTKRDAPAERGWWVFQQRAYPLRHIPEGAQMRALRQTRDAHTAAVDGDRWINIGPAPILAWRPLSGRVTSIAVDPGDNSHWLIGGAQGGVWETRDNGATWIPKTDDQASLAIGAVAFAPSDARIIYVGTGEPEFFNGAYAGQGVLKSTDAGTTWELLATATFARTSFSDIKAHPTDPSIVMAATTRGAAGRFAMVLPEELSAAPPRGVFKSVDGGATWSQRLNGEATDLEVDPANFSHQYAGIGEIVGSPLNGVYRSTDAGDTWRLVDGPWSTTPGRVGRVELALAPSQPNVLYVSMQDTRDGVGKFLALYRTDNAWAPAPVWVQIPTGATDDGSGTHGYCGWSVDVTPGYAKPQCFYNHTLLVDQSDPNILYAGGVPLWRFDGTSWAEISKTADLQHGIHVDQQTLAWAGTRLIVGNDGGVWSTNDDGATWSDHNTSLAITQFYTGALHPANPNFALAGSQDNGVETWAGADAWSYFAGGDFTGVAFSSSQPATRWALVNYSLTISQAVTRGNRVTLLSAGNGIDLTNAAFVSRFEKCPANEDVFIAGTDNLWKSTDFFSAPGAPGPHWSANGPEMGECKSIWVELAGDFGTSAGCITALAFAASDTTCSTYAFATGDGRLRRTLNGGSTWDDLDASNAVPDRFVTDLAFAPTDANILYTTLSGFDEGTPGHPGHVFKTTSALAAAPAWSDVSPPADQPQNAIAVDPVDPQVVYVGADTGVWKSSDGAATWAHMGPESGMPNVAVFDVQIHPTVRRPFAFTHGRGAFMIACRSDAECDDQDIGNGAETCDLVSGRCQAGIAPPTSSPTATPSATPAPTATPTASATLTITATPSVMPTSTPTVSPTVKASLTATATPSPTPVPTQTRTVTPSSTPTGATSGSGSGCSMTPAHRADAAAGVAWFWLAALLWRAVVTRFLRMRDQVSGAPNARS